jgi:hypothetical protein
MKNRRYLRPHMEAELGEEAYKALFLLEWLHATVWTHFDPGMDRGDKDQPVEIKNVLREVPKLFERFGLCIEGFEKKNEEVV